MNVKSENRKALPKFLLLLLIAGLVGGAIGFVVGLTDVFGLDSAAASAGINAALRAVTPWAIPVTTVLTLGSGFLLYRSAKRLCDAWDGGDETDATQIIDQRLNWVLLLSAIQTLLTLFFFSAASYYEVSGMMYHVGVFLLSIGLSIFAQQKAVDLTRRMNPEKKGSVYDKHFQKKWLESCDEAERQQLGQAAFHAYSLTSRILVFLWAALMILNMIFGFGMMPSFVVLLVQAVMQVSYTMECIRISKKAGGPA